MKFLHITYHFQYADRIEALLDRHEIQHYVRYSMVEGRDREGKHFGSKVFPGSCDVVQAVVPEERLEALLGELEDFRQERESHRHLEALVLPVESSLQDASAPSATGGKQ